MSTKDMNEHERKFDPAGASKLDDPERQRYLPHARIVDLLRLSGTETVVDYGAGTGTVSVELGRSLEEGIVYAVEENPKMARLLEEKLSGAGLVGVRPVVIRDNQVPLPDESADRVLAVNLLHEVAGEGALAEMHRLLRPEGFLLIVDWDSEVERDQGPPDHVALSQTEARRMLEEAGFNTQPVAAEEFPYHFAFIARREV
ncbi:MAG: methyltransferase domain-containing protein [Rubrobacter sp.]|nr:methyltransferase domain-containing protein [Rubrobacter sp.]